MRLLSISLMILGLLAGYGAFAVAANVDLSSLTADGRLGAQMAFNALALCGLGLPALSLVALNDDIQLRRRFPHRYSKARKPLKGRYA